MLKTHFGKILAQLPPIMGTLPLFQVTWHPCGQAPAHKVLRANPFFANSGRIHRPCVQAPTPRAITLDKPLMVKNLGQWASPINQVLTHIRNAPIHKLRLYTEEPESYGGVATGPGAVTITIAPNCNERPGHMVEGTETGG
jgi:hypothetical protein